MNRRSSCRLALVLLTCAAAGSGCRTEEIRGVLLSSSQATAARLSRAREYGRNAVILELKGGSDEVDRREREAAAAIESAGFQLYYWIEVARNPRLAMEHPEWMASLQGHDEWRRLFPQAPRIEAGEVMKTYPWVPILYKEAFDAHLSRVQRLLAGKPTARGIFLNDLQGGPSACGCGNTLCRWTADYGPLRTATSAGDGAATDFVEAVGGLAPGSTILPVWVTECEEADGETDGACAGVGCYRGICWKAYARQLTPLADTVPHVGVLLAARSLGRDAHWIERALESFETELARVGSAAVPARRVIAVLQAWDGGGDTDEQIARVRAAGAGGYVLSFVEIDQRWEPRAAPIEGE